MTRCKAPVFGLQYPRWIASLIGGLLAANALAAPMDLPPIWDAGGGEQHVGKIVWRELVTPDLKAAEDFYGSLFGWTFRDVAGAAAAADTEHRYAIALLEGRPVAGLVQRAAPAGTPVQPAWLSFFSVADVDESRRSAQTQGAQVLAEPRDYGRRGREAILRDPQGAVFGILASRTGGAPDEMAEPGDWIWASLLVRDADKDAAFYQALFGYEVFDMPSPDGLEHVVLSSDDLARASVNDMPDRSSRRHPHWLGFVRVFDVGAMAARAHAMGGRVLVEPRADRHGGQLAVVADPQGAVVGLMDWSESDAPVSAP
jgi:predicted enzyme related to lactoylglutathione lyase